MVDDDRLDDLLGGSDDDKQSSTEPSRGSTKSQDSDKQQTKKDKLSQFKSNSSSGSTGSTGSGTEDIKNLLFCLANMDAYTRVVAEHDNKNFNRSQTQIKKEFAKDVAGEITSFLGVFDVRDITDEYGYSWQNIMEIALNNHDFKGDSLKTNSGNPSKQHVKELLDCVANITLYVEGNYQNKKEMDNRKMRDKTILAVSESMYEQYKEFISKSGVQRIAESYGYDWEDDIIKDVLENQDFESKIEG